MLATQYAEDYGIEKQGEKESDYDFKYRVAGKLREQGKIIEAHEVFNDKLYDQDENVMTGVMGAMAFAMQGDSISSNGKRKINDDFVAGTIVKNTKPQTSSGISLMTVPLYGFIFWRRMKKHDS